jgi:hypothetical protein
VQKQTLLELNEDGGKEKFFIAAIAQEKFI